MWSYDAVRFVSKNGLMNGYDDSRFGPNDNLSRAQFAQVLYNKVGKPTATVNELNFTDARKTSSWAKEAMLWATEQDIVNGKGNGNGILDPTGKATHAETEQMLKNYLEE